MPIPKPKKDESKEDFIDRCMSDEVMKDEYKDTDQRLAICNDQWDKEKKTDDGDAEERGAIKSHKTATSDEPWGDDPYSARVKTDQDPSYFKKIYAWQDPEGDERKKTSYKFIHHEVSEDGTPGAANINQCQNRIAVLNGARAGTTIPSKDRKGVWNHLASHIRDAGKEPAELKSEKELDSMPPNYERRYLPVEELRVIDGDDGPIIEGYAAVFNKPSEILNLFGQKFVEKIAPGFFKNTLKKSDARSTLNHNPDILLGRESAGTLKLNEDEHGLFMRNFPPDTQYIRDVVLTPMKRKDIKEQSFGFTVKTDQWEENKETGVMTRTLIECDQLFDTGPVTFPAYPDTSVALRSYEQWQKQNRSEPEPTGVIPEGWEDITSADADKAEEDLHDLDIRLRKIEVSKL